MRFLQVIRNDVPRFVLKLVKLNSILHLVLSQFANELLRFVHINRFKIFPLIFSDMVRLARKWL